MKESPLQKAIRKLDTLYKQDDIVPREYIIEIMEQMELDMLEEFKQVIDNAFKE